MTFARLCLNVGCLVMLCLPFVQAGDQLKGNDKLKAQNRLAKERSPYLLMHAHNPVDWYPWGQEAFDKAKKEGKLVFISIGYSSCYWCHVMERESFNHADVAKLLNEKFVCIKVDREERPDVDQIYMTALTVLQRGRGGWPLSMFLTPEGKPVVGGTYWPREDKEVDGEKVRGFKSIIKVVGDAFRDNPKAVLEQANTLAAATIEALDTPAVGKELVELDRKLVEGAIENLKETFDATFGGFGATRGAKFPLPCRLEFLLRQAEKTKSAELLKMVTVQLEQMALGGIYDHLGGGFHRYSTERTWTVPHFEKMLYDNAQLVEVYARAYRQTKNPLYTRVLRETLAYVAREMTLPDGGFYSSQDAETDEEEGRFYVWTDKELDAALPDKEANQLVRQVYGASAKPNFEGKYHILRLAKPLPEIAKDMKLTETDLEAKLAPSRKLLFEARGKRAPPFLNRIMLTAWSGQMIAGYAEAGQALGDKTYLATAARAADFVLQHQKTPEGRLLRAYGAAPGEKPRAAVNGYLEDYAFLVHGLLTLHDATKEARWLKEAKALTDTMLQHHADKKQGGYFFTANDHEKLFARTKDQFDGAQPAANSLALRNLVRLWAATGEARYREEAEKSFRGFAGSMKSFPMGLTAMTSALDLYLDVRELRDKK